MCICCYYYTVLPTFSICFEYRSREDFNRTICNYISKPREDRGVLFIHREYYLQNFVEESLRTTHPGSLFRDMTAEGMPMWERTRIIISSEETGLRRTIFNRNFTFMETIDELADFLRPHGEEAYWDYRKQCYNKRCELLEQPQD